jgi:hypothetical protein
LNQLEYRSPPDKRPYPSKLCQYALGSLLGALAIIPMGFIGLLLAGLRHVGGHSPAIAINLLIFGPAAIAVVCGILALRAIKAADGGLHGTTLAWIGLGVSVPYLLILLSIVVLGYIGRA